MRDPRVHIKRSDLIKVLEPLSLTQHVDEIINGCYPYNIRNLVITDVSKKKREKLQRIGQLQDDVVEDFVRVYTSILLDKKIKAARIDRNSKAFLTIKEITQQAVDFNKMFDLSQTAGFSMYVTYAIEVLGKDFSVYRLKGSADRIIKRMEHTLEVRNYDWDKIMEMTDAYKRAMARMYKKNISIESTDQLVHFVRACEVSGKYNASAKDWIDAQFERFAYLNAPPEFSGLYNDNAILSYQKSDKAKIIEDVSTKTIILKKDIGKRGQGQSRVS
jgi:hypothetical protein